MKGAAARYITIKKNAHFKKVVLRSAVWTSTRRWWKR